MGTQNDTLDTLTTTWASQALDVIFTSTVGVTVVGAFCYFLTNGGV